MTTWPKEVAFYNAGDNFEVTPEMSYRLFVRNKDEPYWSAEHNEKTVIAIMPKVELQKDVYVPKLEEIFRHHCARFGADHMIYNAVMQAFAFAKDLPRCTAMFQEMKDRGLVPNGQTYVNLMLAAKLSGKSKKEAESYFHEAVQNGSLTAVMRLDTELSMWWDQMERLGSFSAPSGLLSNKEEGAKPLPRDMWATWGWDRRTERKFITQRAQVEDRAASILGDRRRGEMAGTVYKLIRRQPWASYRGMLPWDYNGPRKSSRKREAASASSPPPPALLNSEVCQPAF